MNFIKYFASKFSKTSNVSVDTYFMNIREIEIDKWKLELWKKHNVEKLINHNGFHLKEDGRSGSIYFVENNKLCQIHFEISGVKEFDILIFFDQLSQWDLPKKEYLSEETKNKILESLKAWLNKEKIKSDL